MLLSLVLHTYSMRYVLPAAVMMGTAPTYILAWGAWRLLSTLLPARFYHQVDDRLYTIYQSMVLFFFENYTGVQIILFGDLTKREYISNNQSTGLTILKHVLTPWVKATHVAVDSMKSYFDAVYEVTIAYEVDHKGQRKVAPSMADVLYKECPRIYIYIERIELKDIPEEQMFMRGWLHNFFF